MLGAAGALGLWYIVVSDVSQPSSEVGRDVAAIGCGDKPRPAEGFAETGARETIDAFFAVLTGEGASNASPHPSSASTWMH